MTPDSAKPSAARLFFLGVAGYFALQIAGRTLLGGAVELDSAVQLVKSQTFQWGYDVQPPLYAWLQAAFIGAFGVNLFSLVALKFLALAGTGCFVFHAVRVMTDDFRCAAVATLGLALLPQLLWESQRDQTDSVLATMLAAAALWLFVRLHREPKLTWYLAFGAVAALGCLSKYNYAVFLAALLLGAVSLPEFRRVVASEKLCASALAFAAVAAPHAAWMNSNWTTVMARAGEVHVTGGNIFTALGASFGSLVVAVVAFSGLAVAAYAVIFAKAPETNPETETLRAHRRLLGRVLLVGGLLCLAMVLLAQARFKDRWMQPLLFLTPVWLTLLVARRLDARRWKWFAGLTLTLALGVLVVLFALPYWAAAAGRERYLNPDYTKLAAAMRANGFQRGLILAADAKIGGNLRLAFPDSRVGGVNFLQLAPRAPGEAVILVWSANGIQTDSPPPALGNSALELAGGIPIGHTTTFVEIPREHTTRRPLKFGFFLLPPRPAAHQAPTGSSLRPTGVPA